MIAEVDRRPMCPTRARKPRKVIRRDGIPPVIRRRQLNANYRAVTPVTVGHAVCADNDRSSDDQRRKIASLVGDHGLRFRHDVLTPPTSDNLTLTRTTLR